MSAARTGMRLEELERGLGRADYRLSRRGGHRTFTNGDRILVVPEVDPVPARVLEIVLRDAGISKEEFRRLADPGWEAPKKRGGGD